MRNAELPGKGRARHDAYRYTPHSAFRIPHFYLMRRVLIVSPTYLNPANRGKLRALAARDLDVTVGVPERSREAALGRTVEVGWERQNGVEVFPIPVRHWAHAAEARFGKRALVSLLRDKRPDVIQVEQEPTTRACQQVVRVARKLKLPVVLFTLQNVDVSLPFFPRVRRRRALRRLNGAIPGSPVAEAMAHEVAVIGTGAGATPEVIGDAGAIVPPGDPAALAGALRRLTATETRRPLAQAGRARVMQLFSDDAVAERTVAFWKEVVK